MAFSYELSGRGDVEAGCNDGNPGDYNATPQPRTMKRFTNMNRKSLLLARKRVLANFEYKTCS